MTSHKKFNHESQDARRHDQRNATHPEDKTLHQPEKPSTRTKVEEQKPTTRKN